MSIIKLCTYNIEWMSRLFRPNSDEPWCKKNTNPQSKEKADREAYEKYSRSLSIAEVIKNLKADLIGICEAPPTAKHLENWLGEYLPDLGYKVLMPNKNFLSLGQQQLAIIYNSKVQVEFAPENDSKKHPFNARFEVDTDDDKIKEIYDFYTPPLEARLSDPDGKELSMLMVAHPKSKGIFSHVDMVHLERTTRRNQLKLYAESMWIRLRVEQWLIDAHNVVVMGDFNDGPDLDFDEQRYRKSSFEFVMGSLWDPLKILANPVGKPEWKSNGWIPASAHFKDRFTGDYVDVLIDHILLSQKIKFSESPMVWNPYQFVKEITKQAGDAVIGALKKASDHFPVTVEAEIN